MKVLLATHLENHARPVYFAKPLFQLNCHVWNFEILCGSELAFFGCLPDHFTFLFSCFSVFVYFNLYLSTAFYALAWKVVQKSFKIQQNEFAMWAHRAWVIHDCFGVVFFIFDAQIFMTEIVQIGCDLLKHAPPLTPKLSFCYDSVGKGNEVMLASCK